MTTAAILTLGDPRLRRVAPPLSRAQLDDPDVQRRIDMLVATMRAAQGAGLAATQVGWDARVCAIEVHDNPRYPYKPNIPLTVLVNPEIELLSEETFANYEGCLSVPDLRGIVHRRLQIRVRAWDRHGTAIERTVAGLTAGTYQHEVDHLDGILFVDRVDDPHTLCTWENFAIHQQARFAERARALVAQWGG